MKNLKAICAALAIGGLLTPAAFVQAQDIKPRTIKFATQNPKGHPIVIGMEKFAEIVNAKSRRQDQGQPLPRRHARRRCAEHLRAAGRHARDGRDELRHPGLAGQGVRGLRLPVHVRQRAGGRCGGRRPVREDDARQARRQEHPRPRLLGARLSQHHQQQAAAQQGGGHRRAEAARDSQRDQRRLGQRPGRQPDADGVPRGVRRAGPEGDRRAGEPVHRDQRQQALRGAEVPGDHQPPVQPADGDHQQEALGLAFRRREEDPHRRGRRSRRLPAQGVARAGRRRRWTT